MPSGHSIGIGVEKKEETQSISKQDDSVGESSHPNEGESRVHTDQVNDTYTTVTTSKCCTVQCKVNAILDDASTKTWLH